MDFIARSIRIPAPPEQVFSYVANYQNTLEFMAHLTRFQPLNNRPYGLGSRFTWEATVKGVPLRSEFEVIEYEPPYTMAARTIDGPESSCRWYFEPVPEGTLATLETSYRVPNLPIIRMVGSMLIEREITGTMEQSLRNLRAKLVLAGRTVAAEPIAAI